MERINLIKDSINYLREDFLGLSINLNGIITWAGYLLGVLFLFLLMYGLGRIIIRTFFKGFVKKNYILFVEIALGYALLSSSIFALGLTRYFTNTTVLIIVLLFSAICAYNFIKRPIILPKVNKLIPKSGYGFLLLCFGIVIFLRLIPPQTAGDPLDYHLRFPRVYLNEGTMMVPPLGDESYTTVPHLPEMLYVVSQVFSNGEMSRVIHYGFFVLICIFLYKINFFPKAKLSGQIASILFASSPLILELSMQAFSDFPAVLCILTAYTILLKEKIGTKNIILAGILLGTALASKLWVLYYFPFLLLFVYLITKSNYTQKIKSVLLFGIATLLVVLPWYIRGYILKGDPFYVNTDQGRIDADYNHIKVFIDYFTPSGILQKYQIRFDYNPLYLLGVLIFVYFWIRRKIKVESRFKLLILSLLLSIVIVPVAFNLNRYVFPYLIVMLLMAGVGFDYLFRNILLKFSFSLITVALLAYYLINTLIILPYGLGWADSGLFLKRNLVMAHATYYDYNGEFGQNINPNETVINYGLSELFYANFKYKNLYNFFDQSSGIFKKPSGLNKLVIRGGDYKWMCSKVKIKNCNDYGVTLLTHDMASKQYLYKIETK